MNHCWQDCLVFINSHLNHYTRADFDGKQHTHKSEEHRYEQLLLCRKRDDNVIRGMAGGAATSSLYCSDIETRLDISLILEHQSS